MKLEITKQDLKDLKAIRNYFGEHDKSMFEHKAYAVLNRIIGQVKHKHIGIICLNKHDFLDYLKCNNITVRIGEVKKTFISGNITYIMFSNVCDMASWDIDDFKETILARYNKDYEQIKMICQVNRPIIDTLKQFK